MQFKNLSNYFDPFVAALIGILVVGILIPVPAAYTAFLTSTGAGGLSPCFSWSTECGYEPAKCGLG